MVVSLALPAVSQLSFELFSQKAIASQKTIDKHKRLQVSRIIKSTFSLFLQRIN